MRKCLSCRFKRRFLLSNAIFSQTTSEYEIEAHEKRMARCLCFPLFITKYERNLLAVIWIACRAFFFGLVVICDLPILRLLFDDHVERSAIKQVYRYLYKNSSNNGKNGWTLFFFQVAWRIANDNHLISICSRSSTKQWIWFR